MRVKCGLIVVNVGGKVASLLATSEYIKESSVRIRIVSEEENKYCHEARSGESEEIK